MVSAIVLASVARGKVDEVAQNLLQLDGVAEVFSVAGQFDMVVLLRTSTNEQVAELVTTKIRDLPNILNTQTLIAFKVYSREELGHMFGIGQDDEQ